MRKTAGWSSLLAVLMCGCPGAGSEGDTASTSSETSATTTSTTDSTETSSSSTSGDGDGDPATGDGDGEPSTGDGDGEPSTGDGDGDETGDGDGDPVKFDFEEIDAADTQGVFDDSDIEVVITGDNAYGFGYGDDEGINNYYGGIENTTAGQIFNCNGGPEEYLIPAEEAAFSTYLYIIGYADSSVTQGVLGRFRKLGEGGDMGDNIFTGDPEWEVCATGMNYSPGSGGPDQNTISLMIQACNDDALDPLTSSVGWVDSEGTEFGALAIGEDNTTPYNGGPQAGNEFPITCQMKMDLDARWMWFNWDPANVVWPQQSPFLWPGGGSNPDHQFLIFRLASASIPDPVG